MWSSHVCTTQTEIFGIANDKTKEILLFIVIDRSIKPTYRNNLFDTILFYLEIASSIEPQRQQNKLREIPASY